MQRGSLKDEIFGVDDLREIDWNPAFADHRVKQEFYLNSVVNRVPFIDLRMRLYARYVHLEDPSSSSILRHTEIYGAAGLFIGAGTQINRHVLLDGRGGLYIGRHVAVAERVFFMPGDHHPDEEFRPRHSPIRVGDRAVIYAGAFVARGVSIGEGAMVAGGSIVTRDVEPWTIVAGAPARPVRDRNPNQNYTLTWRPNWR
jgi:acetyltransferase-like isoleucine patch superfamily enzyme